MSISPSYHPSLRCRPLSSHPLHSKVDSYFHLRLHSLLAIARLTLRNHLRPFLGRVQAQGGPDLFTPNPSLLHHLPQQNGASHGLVNTSQSSASTSGGGSAGRAGYQGGSAGSGGGYTVCPLLSLYNGRELMCRATQELSHHYHILPPTHLLVFEMMTREEQRGGVQYHSNHLHTDLSP
jgi:hypothetical protein